MGEYSGDFSGDSSREPRLILAHLEL